MTGAAAAKATDAADALLDWLSRQPAREATATDTGSIEEQLSEDAGDGGGKNPGIEPASIGERDRTHPSEDRGPRAAAADCRAAMRLPTPDWLQQRLTVTGRAADLAHFRETAAGAGIIPWHLDLDRLEEEYFHLLVSAEQRSLSVAGARLFARKLRDAVGQRHEVAVSRVGQSRACAFDLHALIPVPGTILALGPDEPEALAWLWEHWGTTAALRHVAEEILAPAGRRGDEGQESVRVTFWSADWTPWRALTALAQLWPALHFDIRPTYDPP